MTSIAVALHFGASDLNEQPPKSGERAKRSARTWASKMRSGGATFESLLVPAGIPLELRLFPLPKTPSLP